MRKRKPMHRIYLPKEFIAELDKLTEIFGVNSRAKAFVIRERIVKKKIGDPIASIIKSVPKKKKVRGGMTKIEIEFQDW